MSYLLIRAVLFPKGDWAPPAPLRRQPWLERLWVWMEERARAEHRAYVAQQKVEGRKALKWKDWLAERHGCFRAGPEYHS